MVFNFNEILNYILWNNSLKEYLIAFVVFGLTIIGLKIFKGVIIQKLKKLAAHTPVGFDDLLINIIASVGWLLYSFFALYLASQFIRLPEFIEKTILLLFFIVITYYIVRGIQKIIDYGFQKLIKKKQKEEQFDASIINLLSKILKGALWGIAAIIIFQNLGYNISALVAGFGIGGIAIAFALQNILSDIFASFSIYFDKPFQVDDFIIIGDDKGIVKKIGIKSTRIQTLQGEELVISNKELTESRVHNYKKMEKRRIVFVFGVTYETPTEKVKKIPSIIKDIMEKTKLADIDRVHFKEFADFSLNFEVVYYLKTSDYAEYMDTQQEINLAMKERFEQEKIEFAYPTQTIFIQK